METFNNQLHMWSVVYVVSIRETWGGNRFGSDQHMLYTRFTYLTKKKMDYEESARIDNGNH